MDYLPYGEQIAGGTGTTHKFTGKERDAESGLDDFGARYDSSAVGRFLSPDNGIDQNTGAPQSLNLYAYVRNNPVNSVDLDGRLTIIVPGTNWSASDWNMNMKMINEAREQFHDSDVRILGWEPSSLGQANLDHGAAELRQMVSEHHFEDGEQLNIIGASRGGAVATEATIGIAHPVNNLITLETPNYDNPAPTNIDLRNVGTWINVSIKQDHVPDLVSDMDWRWRGGAHNLSINAPKYSNFGSQAHSAAWFDDYVRNQWWSVWHSTRPCVDVWDPKSATLTGCPAQ